MSELLPCPFCGGEAETLTAESIHGGYLFGIMCNDCRSRGDVYDTEAEAIEAWNTRSAGTCEPPYGELLRCLENDWNIRASWDGLRKFWCIELTEEGVKLRDAELRGDAE